MTALRRIFYYSYFTDEMTKTKNLYRPLFSFRTFSKRMYLYISYISEKKSHKKKYKKYKSVFVKICIQTSVWNLFTSALKGLRRIHTNHCLWKAVLRKEQAGPMRYNFYFLLCTFKFLTLDMYYFYNFLKVKKCNF